MLIEEQRTGPRPCPSSPYSKMKFSLGGVHKYYDDAYLKDHPRDLWALAQRERWERDMDEALSSHSIASGPTRVGMGVISSDDLISVPDRTSAVVRGLDLILDHHDAKTVIRSQICDQITEYLNTASNEKIWVKRVKYLLVRPLAQYLKCELPSLPDLDFKFKGAARKWVSNRLNAKNRKNVHLWYSWFQAKRCALESSEKFIREVYDEHLCTLTRPDPGNLMTIADAFQNRTFEYVLKKVRKGVEEKLGRPTDRDPLDHTVFTTTKSGCFEATRSMGGQHRELRRILLPVETQIEHDVRKGSSSKSEDITYRNDYDYVSFTENLHSMLDFGRIVGSKSLSCEIREPCGWEDWKDLAFKIMEMNMDNGPLCCKIQGVIEPLKVRVISKGEALPYYSQRALQKAMHGVMRRMPCFRLIGRPFSPTDLMDLRCSAQSTDEWFSIDYSGATDGLSWSFSSMILRYLLAKRPTRELDIALRVLGPHELWYPKRKNSLGCPTGFEVGGLQTNGQLMGSILSFPILCLANLATYLLTMAERHSRMENEDVLNGVLVNGDDMVYAAPPDLWGRHCRVSRDLGLEMSVGKAYHHSEYANINSTSVLYRISNEKATPFQIDYLNTGLFFRTPVQKKVSEEVRQEREERSSLGLAASHHEKIGVVANINALLKGCRNARKMVEVLKKYLTMFPSVFQDECACFLHTGRELRRHTRNLFIPESLGGMGIDPPPGWKFRTKEADRVLAHSLMSSYPCDLSRQRPFHSFDLLEVEPDAEVPWVKLPERIGDIPIYRICDWSKKLRMKNMIHGCHPVAPCRGWVMLKNSLRPAQDGKPSMGFKELNDPKRCPPLVGLNNSVLSGLPRDHEGDGDSEDWDMLSSLRKSGLLGWRGEASTGCARDSPEGSVRAGIPADADHLLYTLRFLIIRTSDNRSMHAM